jgi:hypothetical protein
VTTTYDQDDQPTQAEAYDANGQIVCRIVRTYNVNGQVTEEKPAWINSALAFLDKMPAEQRAQLNPEAVKRFSQAMVTMMNDQAQAGAWYTYDSQNRLTTTRERNTMFEKTTTISYKTEGEKAEEQASLTFNSTIPLGVPHRINEEGRLIPVKSDTAPHQSPFPAKPFGTSCACQYDSYGNWIKQTRNDPANPDQTSIVRNRKFTYYQLPILEFRPSKAFEISSSAFRQRHSSHSPARVARKKEWHAILNRFNLG